MTKDRKNRIKAICQDLRQSKTSLEKVLNEEECSFDNMPENLQGSMRGMESEDAIDTLNEAVENLEEVIDNIDSI